MKIVNSLEYDVWTDFVDNHPQGNIFHTSEMFEVYSGARGYHPMLWAATENGRVLALHLPVQITLIGGPLRLLTTRDVDFGGVLVENSNQGQHALALLLKAYNQRVSGAPLFTELRNVADQTRNQDVLERYGYIFEGNLNYLLDLRRDEQTILQSFKRSTRNRIRKAVRRGDILVEEITDREKLPLFNELLIATYKNAHVPLADISLFESAFDILRPKKMAIMTIAYVAGEPKAAQASILYKDVIYGWYNGVDRSCGDCNEFLLWNLLRWGVKNGYSVFDFGGAGKPEEDYGVRDFKAKFNGKLVNYGRNTRIHAQWRMKISQNAYQVARKIFPVSRLGMG